MSRLVNEGLVSAGVELVLGAEVTGLELDGDRVTGVRWDGGTRDADLVVGAVGGRLLRGAASPRRRVGVPAAGHPRHQARPRAR